VFFLHPGPRRETHCQLVIPDLELDSTSPLVRLVLFARRRRTTCVSLMSKSHVVGISILFLPRPHGFPCPRLISLLLETGECSRYSTPPTFFRFQLEIFCLIFFLVSFPTPLPCPMTSTAGIYNVFFRPYPHPFFLLTSFCFLVVLRHGCPFLITVLFSRYGDPLSSFQLDVVSHLPFSCLVLLFPPFRLRRIPSP